MKQFHAHVYYEPSQADQIQSLVHLAQRSSLKVWRMFEVKVGPHALPMLELHFNETVDAEARTWLENNRGELSVLIHEDSGDDHRDHMQATWLGTPLPIRYEFFDEVKANAKLAIHK